MQPLSSVGAHIQAKEAIDFLVARIAEQARIDSVRLTQTEITQLSFTEETASQQEIEAAVAFDTQNDSDEFEARVSKLLRRAFENDCHHGRRAVWESNLAALRDHDVYVLVMVDQAGIPRPKPRLRPLLPASPRSVSKLMALAASGMLSAAGFLYFFILPIHSSKTDGEPAFPALLARLRVNDTTAAALFVLWICASVLFGYMLRPPRPTSRTQ